MLTPILTFAVGSIGGYLAGAFFTAKGASRTIAAYEAEVRRQLAQREGGAR